MQTCCSGYSSRAASALLCALGTRPTRLACRTQGAPAHACPASHDAHASAKRWACHRAFVCCSELCHLSYKCVYEQVVPQAAVWFAWNASIGSSLLAWVTKCVAAQTLASKLRQKLSRTCRAAHAAQQRSALLASPAHTPVLPPPATEGRIATPGRVGIVPRLLARRQAVVAFEQHSDWDRAFSTQASHADHGARGRGLAARALPLSHASCEW